MSHFLEIHFPGDTTERHEIIGPEASIGSAPSATIRPEHGEQLEPEQLKLVPTDAGCHVSLMPGVVGPLMFGGAPQWQALVPWGEEVFLRGVRYTFLRAGSAKRPSSVVLIAAVVGLAFGGYLIFGNPGESAASKMEIEPPSLAVPSAACPDPTPTAAAEHGARAERAALAKEERSAFDVTDGVGALASLAESAACYGAAGNAESAERVKGELVAWMAQMNEDYAATRLRLKLALEHGRLKEALAAVAHLQALVPKGSYADWLAAVRREIERKTATSGKDGLD
jgi:hypothetical protein